jgi:hypothetical protein
MEVVGSWEQGELDMSSYYSKDSMAVVFAEEKRMVRFTTAVHESVDKTKWARGPWDEEPDEASWTDVATDLPCSIKRHPELGHLCGYVGVTAGHPYFDKDDIFDLGDLSVHGGITFTALSPAQVRAKEGESVLHMFPDGHFEEVRWLGFDCAHAWDIAPGMEAEMRSIGVPHRRMDSELYRPLGYVVQECESLARQLSTPALEAGSKT